MTEPDDPRERDGPADDGDYLDGVALLGEAVDEAMSPVIDRVWGPILPAVRAELDADARTAEPYRPTPEETIERMRDNGLDDPDPDPT